ncbi:MAG: SurA N-terminal domain-containing protein [Clostridia bacterium]|nr:SurA N-terminal domain-containing protein [Clostridia bacterium]
MRNRVCKLIALAMILLLALTGCNMIQLNEERDKAVVVAQVNDTVITKGEVQNSYDYYKSYYEAYNSYYGYTAYDLSNLENDIIDSYVNRELIRQQATKLGIDPTTEENAKTIADAAQAQLDELVAEELEEGHIVTEGLSDEEAKAAAIAHLEEEGITLERLTADQTDTFLSEKVRASVTDEVTVSEEDIKAAFDEKVASDVSRLGESTYLVEMYGANGTTVYWYPEGYRTVKHVLLKMSDEQSAAMSTAKNAVTDIDSAITTVKTDMTDEDIAAAEEAASEKIDAIKAAAEETISTLKSDAEALKAAAQAAEDAAEAELDEVEQTAQEVAEEASEEMAEEVTEALDQAVEETDAEQTESTETESEEPADEAEQAADESTEETAEEPAEETADETADETEQADEEDLTTLSLEELLVRKAQAEADFDVLSAETMISMQDRIDEVYAALDAGTPFDEVMATYGEDPGMQREPAMTTGYYVSEKSTYWDTAFRDAAMSLEKVGDVSEPVLGSNGVHIICYNSDVTSGEIDIETVREDLLASTEETKQQEAYDAALESWRNEAKVKTWPERLK